MFSPTLARGPLLFKVIFAFALNLSSAEMTVPDFSSSGNFWMGFWKGWIKGSVVEPSKADFRSFVREQRQLEQHSTRKHPDVGHILSFCVSQAGLRARQGFYRKSIIQKMLPCVAIVVLKYTLI